MESGATKKKRYSKASPFTVRLDKFTLDMVERIAYEEDKTRTEAMRTAVKSLYLKKYGESELDKVRQKHGPLFIKDIL